MKACQDERQVDERHVHAAQHHGAAGHAQGHSDARHSQAAGDTAQAGLDIAGGATRANSGIVHAGFDPKPGTLKARYNVAGAAAYPRWQQELSFTCIRDGALVLAFSDEERSVLDELVVRAQQNGAEEVRVVDAEELRALEPAVPAEAVAALYAPTSAVVDPYGVAFAAAENAVDNGAEFLFGRAVVQARQAGEGFELALVPQAWARVAPVRLSGKLLNPPAAAATPPRRRSSGAAASSTRRACTPTRSTTC